MSVGILNTVIINNPVSGYSTTTTTGGITVLDATSPRIHEFTGNATQTIELPKLITLANGFEFEIINNSTEVLTISTVETTLVNGTQSLTVAPFILTVDSTTGFPTAGSFSIVTTTSSPQTVTYTGGGGGGTTFTGCVAGGAFTTNNNSVLTSLDHQVYATVASLADMNIKCVNINAVLESDGWFKIPDTVTSITSGTDTTTTSLDGTVIINGMSISPPAGSYMALFNGQYTLESDMVTPTIAADVALLETLLLGLSSTGTLITPLGTGQIITPGVYDIVAAGSVTGTLNFDAQLNPNALFVIRLGGALTTAASAIIVLQNNADAANIFWIANGAMSTGASSTFYGTMLSRGAAPSLGATNTVVGRLLTTLGMCSIDSSVITNPGPSTSPGIDIRTLSTFAMFTSSGTVTSTGASTINGDVGTNLGTVTLAGATLNGEIYTPLSISGAVVFAFYVNSVEIPLSERMIESMCTIHSQVVNCQGIVTITSGGVLDIRSTVIIGTLTMKNRVFTLIKV
jgi:hypothetical protein